MNSKLLAILLTLAASTTAAQQGTLRLQCDGKYNDYTKGVHNVDSRGAYVEVRGDAVKVVGIAGFSAKGGTTYRKSHEDEASICFTLPRNELYGGCLNRFSGRLNLMKYATKERGSFEQYFDGECRTARPLF